jgi:hypothetical protein
MGGLLEAYRRGKSRLNRLSLTRIIDRFADWYWHDPVRRERHRVEVDVRRLGGSVKWPDDHAAR